MAKMFIGEVPVDLTEDEFVRYTNAVKKAGNIAFQNFRVLENGTIINLASVSRIESTPGTLAAKVVEMVFSAAGWPVPDAVEPVEQINQEPPEDPGVTVEDLRNIKTVQKLSDNEIAAAIGYSPSAVRMALKENRMSADFAAAVKRVYFPDPEPSEG